MKIFLTLLSISLKTNLTSSQAFSSKKKAANITAISIVLVFLLAYASFAAYKMGQQFKAAGMENMLLFFAIVGGSFVTLLNSLISIFNFIFKAKDQDLLFSLPIPTSTIFVTKLFSALLLNYLYVFPIYFPFAIVYLVFAKAQALNILFAVFGYLFMPLFSTFLGLAIGMFLNSFNGFRLAKSIYIIFSLILISLIMVVTSNPTKLMTYFEDKGSNIINITSIVYYPFKLLLSAIDKGSILAFLGFVALSCLPIFILSLISSKNYIKLTSFYSKSKKHKKYTYKETQSSTYLTVMIKKELKRLTSSVNYMLNSCIGPIILIVFSAINMFTNTQQLFGADAFTMTIIMVSMMTLLNSPLSVSISLEGSAFWIYKSLPVYPLSIIHAKLITQLIIFLPLSFIGSILLCISFKPAAIIIMLFLLFVISINIFGALLGMTIGLKKYNLHYTSEIQVIKQSSAVFLTMLLGFLISFGISLPYLLWLSKYISLIWYFVILITLINIANGIIYQRFTKITPHHFNDIM